MPEAVGLSFGPKYQDIAYVPIRNPRLLDPSTKPDLLRDELAVCVPSIQNRFNDALRIVEFVEIYKMLGASKFYFYNFSMNANVNRVLAYYREIGVAEVFEWNMWGKFLTDTF